MDWTLIVGMIAGALAATTAALSMRSDRTKTFADAAVALIAPLEGRIKALEAEITGLHNETESLRRENAALRKRIRCLETENERLRCKLESNGVKP